MNHELLNNKDEIISIRCAGCHRQTIYLKIMNAAENTQKYRPQRILCTQCRLIHDPQTALKKQPSLLNESA